MNIHQFTRAMEKKSYDFLQLFLGHGWNTNQTVNSASPRHSGTTSITHFDTGGTKGLTLDTSLTFDDEEMTKWFLARGADPNAECVLDLTPLSIAVLNRPFHIIELVFHHGGSIEHGQLLHYAARRDASDRLRVLEYICDKGPPIDHVMYQTRLACYEH